MKGVTKGREMKMRRRNMMKDEGGDECLEDGEVCETYEEEQWNERCGEYVRI
ncbi:hypothetical protein E2C01_098605 [Portunus trituberculatus]|uniref:Uncharacterized protein n=1 Tax=Portunus trituberculatus TaxID=210409 RepID=A0A5B7JY86_PORTR|nr:hypothetical protein [Portunus trituberculatus]